MKEKKEDKTRIDLLLVELGLFPSREKAQAHIMAGEVDVDGIKTTTAGTKVRRSAAIVVRGEDKFASRGGEKLSGALDAFGVAPAGKRCLDVGASTGGFTDCLLQRGAVSVCALDVGYGQIAVRLREDPRVTVMDRTNARFVQPQDFQHRFDLISIDVSFISLGKVLPAIAALLADGGQIVALVKPQFEAGPGRVGKGGVVRDAETHRDVLSAVAAQAEECGLAAERTAFSPITGPAGNIEFFLLLRKHFEHTDAAKVTLEDIEGIVAAAHSAFAK